MNLFSDATHMELDFSHCLACFLILGGENAKLSDWIITDMARNIDTASAVLTMYVREGLASCRISGTCEGTSLR